jgi:probable rRNA maturation factor
MGQVHFFFLQKNISLTNRTALKLFLTKAVKKNKKDIQSLLFIFCSDKYLLEINKTHLKHNFYTDIITFDLSENPGSVMGEIYISTDRVRENAGKEGTTLIQELHRVIFHGVLHLCGYNDKSPAQKKEMRLAEDQLLAAYFE